MSTSSLICCWKEGMAKLTSHPTFPTLSLFLSFYFSRLSYYFLISGLLFRHLTIDETNLYVHCKQNYHVRERYLASLWGAEVMGYKICQLISRGGGKYFHLKPKEGSGFFNWFPITWKLKHIILSSAWKLEPSSWVHWFTYSLNYLPMTKTISSPTNILLYKFDIEQLCILHWGPSWLL